ncbi:hypothetical protein ACX80I_12600 [Arthrobacter sp. MDT3-44]
MSGSIALRVVRNFDRTDRPRMFTNEQWLTLLDTLTARTALGELEWEIDELNDGVAVYGATLAEMRLAISPKAEWSGAIELTIEEKASPEDEKPTKEVGRLTWEDLSEEESLPETDKLFGLYELIGLKAVEANEKFAAMIRDDKFLTLMNALSDKDQVRQIGEVGPGASM